MPIKSHHKYLTEQTLLIIPGKNDLGSTTDTEHMLFLAELQMCIWNIYQPTIIEQ